MARLLGTSVPRVLRAARHGLVPVARRGNRALFDADAVERLRHRWGVVPRIQGLRREDTLALAALGRRPFGLRSARALARATGLSPTAAGRALERLAAAGYVERRLVRVVEGRVRDVPVWMVRWQSPEWLAVAATVSTAVLPQRPRTDPLPRRVPARLAHVFWNEDLARLDVERDAVLIAGRILRADDPEATAWMSQTLPRDAIERASRSRGLDPRRARLGQLLAAAR
ncbi:MAG TPA: helix-turn-helix domain-containing protein [Actinomycetes bacterium]|nr:helix-turn-helix domain-containing protein [Actinomycetes bacterium]